MNKRYLLIILFVLLLFPLNIKALSFINVSKYYSGGYYELYDNTNGERVYCLKPSYSACSGGCWYGYIDTIYEGPACAFTTYTGSITSGSSTLHNIISYVQTYAYSSFSCSKYKYVSGSCDANNKNAVEDKNTKITLSKTSEDFTLSDNYYINQVNVALAGSISTYSLSLTDAPTGTIITTDKSSTTNVAGTSINASTVYIKIPSSSMSTNVNFDLNASGSYSTTCKYAVPYFSVWTVDGLAMSKTYWQALGYLRWYNKSVTDKFTVSSKTSFNYSIDPTTIKISKQDITTFNEIPGAKMTITDENNNVIQEFTSTTTPTEFALYPGTYNLTETVSPDGYKKIETVIGFKITNDGVLQLTNSDNNSYSLSGNTIIVYNNMINVDIKISKQDIVSFSEIPGAQMTITDENNSVIKEFTSTTTPTEFSLNPGTYNLTEVVAPEGYQKIETVIGFKITNDGVLQLIDLNNGNYYSENNTLIVYNDIESVNIKISKQDITSHKEIEGASMVLKDSNGNVIEEFISTSTPKEFSLMDGTYFLTEVVEPEGYDKLETTIEFVIGRDRSVSLVSEESKYYTLSDNVLTVYNSLTEVVKVPDTGLNINYIVIGLAIISASIGSYFIYKGKKNKKNK